MVSDFNQNWSASTNLVKFKILWTVGHQFSSCYIHGEDNKYIFITFRFNSAKTFMYVKDECFFRIPRVNMLYDQY